MGIEGKVAIASGSGSISFNHDPGRTGFCLDGMKISFLCPIFREAKTGL